MNIMARAHSWIEISTCVFWHSAGRNNVYTRIGYNTHTQYEIARCVCCARPSVNHLFRFTSSQITPCKHVYVHYIPNIYTYTRMRVHISLQHPVPCKFADINSNTNGSTRQRHPVTQKHTLPTLATLEREHTARPARHARAPLTKKSRVRASLNLLRDARRLPATHKRTHQQPHTHTHMNW